ncbi:MAG: CaiB/BaiF CoA-transferase family protein [Hyphomicrobiaceae bacterium]
MTVPSLGALDGLRVLDLSRHAPGPFVAMMLADHGADVVQIADATFHGEHGQSNDAYMALRGSPADQLSRNKRSIGLDLKSHGGRTVLHRLVERADVLITEWRPGTAERLGADYRTLAALNARLVYCAVSGYGQSGPEARQAGHDLNYVGRSGVLSLLADRNGRPIVPVNILADFGGAAVAAFAILAALTARGRTGRGQFVDASLTDAVRYLATDFASLAGAGLAEPRGGDWVVTGGVPFYDVYETRDGRHVTVAALEDRFFRRLCERLGLTELADAQWRRDTYPAMRAAFASAFLSRTQREWMALLADEDVCVGPVASFTEAVRAAGGDTGAPRLSDTPVRSSAPPAKPFADTDEVLAGLGMSREEIDRLKGSGDVR